MTTFIAGKMQRKQLRLPNLSFQVADTWINYLGYEQFGWWLKFHSWVNRTDTAQCEGHIPYTLESVYKKHLQVSKTTFYRKIKVLWECGLIDVVEYEASERKSQSPKNIIVYEYPFNDLTKQYEPLEKLRDWDKDFESESKMAGKKGGLMKKISTNEGHGLNSETVEKIVDNSSLDGFNSETVDGFNSETVTVSNLVAINYTNNLLTKSNKYNNNTNNLSLSSAVISEYEKILIQFEFTENEREKIISQLSFQANKDLFFSTAKHVHSCGNRIINRVAYFLKGLEMNKDRKLTIGARRASTSGKIQEVPFYNWLEQ
jgi:hypothetical protein